ncbi:hypothetical protein L227DRAFT_223162 [Lentinus tigrinus ALCF2SS1-6]|uniref:Uncharacterized protein n=1 Tax=Lentinus tigrinus ALCF2SS1-6 TaxID=1328759 RepID=A0A5C2S2T0_9APHY|nr:hypothetical protein L227DRAFT_223162 [Lentinus tigrinus ALCF2SS1-6]
MKFEQNWPPLSAVPTRSAPSRPVPSLSPTSQSYVWRPYHTQGAPDRHARNSTSPFPASCLSARFVLLSHRSADTIADTPCLCALCLTHAFSFSFRYPYPYPATAAGSRPSRLASHGVAIDWAYLYSREGHHRVHSAELISSRQQLSDCVLRLLSIRRAEQQLPSIHNVHLDDVSRRPRPVLYS